MNVVVFDIDDTLVDETGFMLKHAPKYLEKQNIDATVTNPNGYDVENVFGLEKKLASDGLSINELKGKCHKIKSNFWHKNFPRYMLEPLKEGAAKTVNNLYNDKDYIILMTMRGKKSKAKENYIDKFTRTKIVPFLTRLQLCLNGVKYNELVFPENIQEKLAFINNRKPDYVFEDQINVIYRIKEPTHVVCVTCNHNINHGLPDNAVRLSDYKNNKAYDLIASNNNKKQVTDNEENISLQNKTNIKNLYVNRYRFKKKFTETIYQLSRRPITKWVKNKYNPILYGVDNIPKDNKPFVIVSNHRHDLDPLFPSMVIDRPIHWTADLKMFIGKENLFSKSKNPIICGISALYMKANGSLPIARAKDINNYGKKYQTITKLNEVNAKTFEESGAYIDSNSIVGIYPEGTINREPHKQNIVPIQSKRAFRLALEHKVPVVPISMVWIPKGIGIENRTIMKISPAIDTNGKTLDEIADLWEQAVNEGIDQSNNIIVELKELKRRLSSFEGSEAELKELEIRLNSFEGNEVELREIKRRLNSFGSSESNKQILLRPKKSVKRLRETI